MKDPARGAIFIVKKKYSLTRSPFFWIGLILVLVFLALAVDAWMKGR